MPARFDFLCADEPLPGLNGATVGDFWRWAYSDVLSNRNRSIFAEYLVGVALGCVASPRVEWDAVDLHYGGYRIEVKSSADCQSWPQSKPSPIRFSVRKALEWDPATGKYVGVPKRAADAYVFCHYPEPDKSKANVLDVPLWDFYVVTTETLNQRLPEAKSISLDLVRKLAHPCKFDELETKTRCVLAGGQRVHWPDSGAPKERPAGELRGDDEALLLDEYARIPPARVQEVNRHFPGALIDRRVLDNLGRLMENSAAALRPPLLACSIRSGDLRMLDRHLALLSQFVERAKAVVWALKSRPEPDESS
jgi:hypothetical protein